MSQPVHDPKEALQKGYIPIEQALRRSSQVRLFGLSLDDAYRIFFRSNALVAIVVLALITFFLFKEAVGLGWLGVKGDRGFFEQSHENMTIYRKAGLEYVDIIRQQVSDYRAITRFLSAARVTEVKRLSALGQNEEQITATLARFDAYAESLNTAIESHQGLLSEWSDVASGLKERYKIQQDNLEEQKMLIRSNRAEEAAAMKIESIDFEKETSILVAMLPAYQEMNQSLNQQIGEILKATPMGMGIELDGKIAKASGWLERFRTEMTQHEAALKSWKWNEPIPWQKTITGYLLGREWLTASFWQDLYGVIPLFVGSLCISIFALVTAVPLGVGAAIYVSQIATVKEQNLIKPYIEFISAIPSVVLGFFGIAILGEFLRNVSGFEFLNWIPFFPIAERLNIATAGLLLGFMAIPTIFSLAEDALNNVPRAYVEASFALGSTRLQTIIKIMVPAALSGILSAVLLGFGRVIGETMVVLLCAGNRIDIPDFTSGLGAFFQPVHTMTGIIAQEMGEVVRGSLHYRALFMVGITLFLLSLIINWIAQYFARRYKLSNG